MVDGARGAVTGPVRMIICGRLSGARESPKGGERAPSQRVLCESGLKPFPEAFHGKDHRGDREKA
jgi:hypothetical protein